MKKFLLYTAGGTTIFIAGAATATYLTTRVLVPVIDVNLAAEKLLEKIDATQTKIEKKVFGQQVTRIPYIPKLEKSSTYGS